MQRGGRCVAATTCLLFVFFFLRKNKGRERVEVGTRSDLTFFFHPLFPTANATRTTQVFYHLGELNDALNYALCAGNLFDVTETSAYVQTLLGESRSSLSSSNPLFAFFRSTPLQVRRTRCSPPPNYSCPVSKKQKTKQKKPLSSRDLDLDSPAPSRLAPSTDLPPLPLLTHTKRI